MTICFDSNYHAKQFFAKCLYRGDLKDNTTPIFNSVKMDMLFKQATVEASMDVQDVEKLLQSKKVKYRWISQF